MSGRDLLTLGRPLGASLILAGLSIVAAGVVGASWAGLSAAVEERDAKADLLQRGAAAGRRARVEPGAGTAVEPFLIADTATLAAARLDADLREEATAAGLAVLSSRASAAIGEPGGADERIGTRIEEQAVVEGQNEAVQTLLSRLQEGATTVLVDGLTVAPAEAAEGSMADPQAPRLRASLTLNAYWRPRPQAPAARR